MEIFFSILLGGIFITIFALFMAHQSLEERFEKVLAECVERNKQFDQYEAEVRTLIEWLSINVDIDWEQRKELTQILQRVDGRPDEKESKGENRETPVEAAG